jgi:hypothetical protein
MHPTRDVPATARALAGVVIALLAGCNTYELDAPAPVPEARPEAERPFVSVSVRTFALEMAGPGVLDGPSLPERDKRSYDRDRAAFRLGNGAFFRTALHDSERVRVVERGGDLRLELTFGRRSEGGTASMAFAALTLGLLPGHTAGVSLLDARVSAPGRAPARYAFECRDSWWVWLPLLPGYVYDVWRDGWQEANRPTGRVHLVRALLFALERDGWL